MIHNKKCENMYNSELYNKCREYVSPSFKTLVKSKDYDKFVKEMSDYGIYISSIRHYIDQTKEFNSVTNYLVQDTNLMNKYTKEVMKEFILALLVRVLDVTRSFKYDENVFRDVYAQFEKELYSSEWNVRVIAPLNNFRSEVDIDLGEREIAFKDQKIKYNLKIRKIPEQEINKFFGGHINFLDRDVISYKFYQFIDILYKVKKDSKNAPHLEYMFTEKFHEIPHILLEKILTALRLFKGGDIELMNYHIKPLSSFFSIGMRSRISSHLLASRYQYELNNLENKDLINFVSKLEGILSSVHQKENREYLDLALRYYNSAKERKNNEDKLIDYMVVLEALYLRGGPELNFRLSHRVASLLGEDEQKRLEIFNNMHALYDLRSKIVHGSLHDYKIPNEDIEKMEKCWNNRQLNDTQKNVVNKYIKEYFKYKSIKRFFDESQKHDNVKQSLDNTRTLRIENCIYEWYNGKIRLLEEYSRISINIFLNLSLNPEYLENGKKIRKEDILKDLDDSIITSKVRIEIQEKAMRI